MKNQTGPKAVSMRVKLADVELNPKNPNVTDEDTLSKIEANIRRTGNVPPIIVRPIVKGKLEPPWILIDGQHRRLIMKDRLGWDEADASVWDVTEREADIALATLNTLHGTDNMRLRAELVQDILGSVPIDQLVGLIPENKSEIEDLLKITQVDLDALVRIQTEASDANDAETPRTLQFIVFPPQEAVIRQALEHIKQTSGMEQQKNADASALEYMAADYLAGAGIGEPPEGGAPED